MADNLVTANASCETTEVVSDGIVKGSFLVTGAQVAVALSGLLWAQVIGYFFGTSEHFEFTDSHFFAFGIVLMVFSLFDQTVGPSFLPVFSEERKRSGERAAGGLAARVMTIVLIVSGVGAALCFAFPGLWVRLAEFLAGSETGSRASELLELQVSYMAPAFVGVAASVVTYRMLNSYKSFFWAQAGEAFMRLAMIATVAGAGIASLSTSNAARMLGLGVAVGSGLRVLAHVVALKRHLLDLRPALARGDGKAMRRFAMLALPLLAGAVVAQLRDLINNYAVLFPLEEGLVSANRYGRVLPMAIDRIVPFSVGVAMFPYFCDLVDRDDLRALGGILTRSGRVLMLGFFAFSGAVVVLSPAFALGLFPKLDAKLIPLVALATAVYVAALPALALEKLLMMGFFSNRRMIAPTTLGIVFSFLSVGISVAGIRYMGLDGIGALAVVAIGYTVARLLKVIALAAMLRRSVPIFPAAETAFFLVRAGAVAGAAAGFAYAARAVVERVAFPYGAALAAGVSGRLAYAVAVVGVAGLAAILGTLLTVRILRMEEVAWVRDWIARRGRGGSG